MFFLFLNFSGLKTSHKTFITLIINNFVVSGIPTAYKKAQVIALLKKLLKHAVCSNCLSFSLKMTFSPALRENTTQKHWSNWFASQ